MLKTYNIECVYEAFFSHVSKYEMRKARLRWRHPHRGLMPQQVGMLGTVVCVAGTAKFAPCYALSGDDFAFGLANKLMGQANQVRYRVPCLAQGSSVTLTSGVLAQHPMQGSAAVST